MVDFISIFFSILWGYISGIALFIFYTLLVFILVSMPLKFIAKKLFKQTDNEEPSKALSFIFIVLMLLPGVTGAFLYMNRENIVKPFTAKLFTYPVTEIIITFPQKIDDKQSKKLQQFFLKYFNQYQKKQFEGGSTYVRGNQLIENEDGVIPHHWKLNDDKLHIFLSDSLSQEKMADLQRIFNIWFPKTIPQKKLADVVSLTMNPENESVLFPLLFKKKDTSKLPIKDQIRLYSNNQLMSIYNLTDSLLDSNNKEEKPPYFFHERYMVSEKNNSNVIINPYSLTFRMSGFDIFKIAGAHAPVEIRCDAVFDIKQGIWEKELLKSATTISTLAKQMSFNHDTYSKSDKMLRVQLDIAYRAKDKERFDKAVKEIKNAEFIISQKTKDMLEFWKKENKHERQTTS